MYLTEKEIFDTPNALNKTLNYFLGQEAKVKSFFSENKIKKFTFLGCGSSFMLAKGAAVLFNSFSNTSAVAIPAGDFLVNSNFWKNAVDESIIISISRSGETSEMVKSIEKIKKELNVKVVSLSMKKDNSIAQYSDLNLIMDWCYDKSVCQTRTVTNLFAALIILASIYSADEKLLQSMKVAIEENQSFIEENIIKVKKIAESDWNKVVVLSDGAICGIGEEAALAFTEIAMLPGEHFHLLDYRHGPIVLNDEKTLTIVLANNVETSLQNDLIKDVKGHGGKIVVIAKGENKNFEADEVININNIESFAACGIPFIFISQITAFYKAISLGHNPDAPKGLDAFITLK